MVLHVMKCLSRLLWVGKVSCSLSLCTFYKIISDKQIYILHGNKEGFETEKNKSRMQGSDGIKEMFSVV